jgi:Glyoxalase-like domain
MKRIPGFVFIVLVLFATATAGDSPGLRFDHIWIVVSPNAPERAALERAGFKISGDVNRHDGQGTASIMVEFHSTFLELLWLDPTVPVAPGLERAAEKFRQRMLWRTSGWCPFGIGLRRTTEKQASLPFPTWSVSAPWMPSGSALEMLTPRDDSRSPSLFIAPRTMADSTEQAARGARYQHPIGVHDITAVQILSPRTYEPIESLEYLKNQGVLMLKQDEQWLIELTFDGAGKKQVKDLRPDLPLIIHY